MSRDAVDLITAVVVVLSAGAALLLLVLAMWRTELPASPPGEGGPRPLLTVLGMAFSTCFVTAVVLRFWLLGG